MLLDKIKSFTDIVSQVDEKLGIRRFCQYLLIGAAIYAVFNFKSIVKDFIELHDQIVYEEHARKMIQRDELLQMLQPMLGELRASLRADRVLYLEYHNSKENLIGIPFKYVDLTISSRSYGTGDVDPQKFKDINSGLITDLYVGLCNQKIIINKGSQDMEFLQNYSNILEFMNESDGSKQQCYINLSGINTPIGLIIAEWFNEEPERDWETIKQISRDYEPRINALVVSKSK